MSGKKSRDKGNRIEREIVNIHRKEGIPAERVPLSGAAGGSFTGDVYIAGVWTAEVKSRAGGDGFRTIERWLEANDLLFLRRDGQKPLVVLPWKNYIILAKLLERYIAIMGTMPEDAEEGREGPDSDKTGSNGAEAANAGAGYIPVDQEGEFPCGEGSQG